MAINRALMNRQMYNMGGASLQAGAPDLRLTGVHPTYSQARKQRMNMAGGGIMGSNAGSMLVAPTADGSRPGYWGIPGWDTIKKIGQTIIPGGETGYVDLYGGGGGGAGDVIKKLGQTIMPGGDPGYVPGGLYNAAGNVLFGGPAQAGGGGSSDENDIERLVYGMEDYESDPGAFPRSDIKTADDPWYVKLGQTLMPGGETGYFDLWNQDQEQPVDSKGNPIRSPSWKMPMALGAAAGLAQQKYIDKQPEFAKDTTGINFQTARQAMDDPNLRFKPEAQYANVAEGGRIGYGSGGSTWQEFLADKTVRPNPGDKDWRMVYHRWLDQQRSKEAQGGRIGYADKGFVEGDTPEVLGPVTPGKGLGDIDEGDFNLSDLGEYTQMYGPEGAGGMPLMELVKKLMMNGTPIGPAIKIAKKIMGGMEGLSQDDDTGGWKIREGLEQPGERPGPDWDRKPWPKLPRPKRRWDDVMPPRDFPGDEGILAPERDFPGDPGINRDPGDWRKRLRERFRPEEEERPMAAEGGLMNLGGMEKDYRQEGGFVPLGGKEKADDVPARLSKNEFVFTADAVRAAGGGDIDQGAEVMENLMTNLEAGGEVSEDSQGLEGARGMFANAQELQKRIV